jgi:23S rRNA (cytidine1920-2'-O)/16S rRNA (cytidine1409-2'-O)-methyltransferase
VRRRLDAELVRRGLASSRAVAVEAVAAGRVSVAGAPALSPARQVATDEPIVVAAPAAEFVSRGGVKLAAALDAFDLDVHGLRCLDVGASTGGFTDCLLQRGAQHVVALDVGRGQLAWSLRNDPRVTVLERTNIRHVEPAAIAPAPEFCVVDVSFISLRTVAPHLLELTTDEAGFVLLVKPQFEAGRARVGKGGVVRDRDVRRAVVEEVLDRLADQGLGVRALVRSPITGADGNVEFLAYARRGAARVDAHAVASIAGGES